ncbi:MAG: oligoendopeptidase F [Deltaproteobacteria bacterium]|nr:oligoendopeptidase F [Deltaproteobacteria bacterium]
MAEATRAKPRSRVRSEIETRFHWNVGDIYEDFSAWQQDYSKLAGWVNRFAAAEKPIGDGRQLHQLLTLRDEVDQLAYRIWFYASLTHDQDQRNNDIDAKRQLVQILFAKARQAQAWFAPALLKVPLETLRSWMGIDGRLAVYRFNLEEVYRQQEHVLDGAGEKLLSLSSRLTATSPDVYSALTTADMEHPTITLSDGEEVTVSYGQYRALLATRREQVDRRAAFEALYGCYQRHVNTHAALYNGVCQRDWFLARARNYETTLDSALHSDNIPKAVLETLLESAKEGAEPLRRYHRLRKRILGLEEYHLYDGSIPLLKMDRRYYYDDIVPWVVDSVAPLGARYQRQIQRAFDERWVDVYENEGKRAGAYSAPVYGVHPYVLLNYNDTLDDVFTLAHELGHSMHTLLAHESQPFVDSSYTIFIAEVASTLNEALLLDYLLERSDDPAERVLLLQHAIDSICGTFYTQVLFADWELQAHRVVEAGQPLTAAVLNDLYRGLLEGYYGDAVKHDPLYGITWARIPHFFRTPYYVYQYATCFASSAHILAELRESEGVPREKALERYLDLLRAGSSDHPMELLRRAGVDLEQAATVQAVVKQLDELVGRLETELEGLQ